MEQDPAALGANADEAVVRKDEDKQRPKRRRLLTEEEQEAAISAYVAEIAEKWPPFTVEQIAQIEAILNEPALTRSRRSATSQVPPRRLPLAAQRVIK